MRQKNVVNFFYKMLKKVDFLPFLQQNFEKIFTSCIINLIFTKFFNIFLRKPYLYNFLTTFSGRPLILKFDIVEQCTQERQNTKWRFKLITNVTVFAALLINISMECPDSVLPESLLKNHSVNCLFSKKRQGTLQRSFVSFPRIGNVHERSVY